MCHDVYCSMRLLVMFVLLQLSKTSVVLIKSQDSTLMHLFIHHKGSKIFSVQCLFDNFCKFAVWSLDS